MKPTQIIGQPEQLLTVLAVALEKDVAGWIRVEKEAPLVLGDCRAR
jgi:hypothetical protein